MRRKQKLQQPMGLSKKRKLLFVQNLGNYGRKRKKHSVNLSEEESDNEKENVFFLVKLDLC
jgi:hypothetical protein